MNIDEIKDELIKYGKMLFVRGLSPSTSGNISARWGDGCIITATGTCLGDLTREDLVLIDNTGNLVEGTKKPSSEKFLHIEIYNTRNDINAVAHTHPPFSTGFAVAGQDMDIPITPEFVYYFGKIPVAKYAPPGSIELVQYTAEMIKNANAALMANHGLIVCAENIKTTFYYTDTIETTAQIYLNASKLGNVVTLSNDDIEVINNMKR